MKNLVTITNGKAVTTSLKVAGVFGRQHKDVLKAIRDLNAPDDFTERNFAPSEYTDPTGRKCPMYTITRDGFTLLAMGFTGKKAMEFKIAYIRAFNEMEERLARGEWEIVAAPGPDSVELLLSTTRSILVSLNRRIESGENVPPHLLKYARNLASFTRQRQQIPAPLTGDGLDIQAVFSLFEPGELTLRGDIYRAYCDRCDGVPMSARRFWPTARRYYKFDEIRKATGRYIIIKCEVQ